MAEVNAPKFERLDMPSESTSGDPETQNTSTEIPVVTEEQQPKETGEKTPPKNTQGQTTTKK
jgi:hypothetical protein